MPERRSSEEDIRNALGASRIIRIQPGATRGPLDLLALRERVAGRLRSSGGRPTDPDWSVTRQVRFREDVWLRLEELALELSREGAKVSPGQLAAVLLESMVEEIDTPLRAVRLKEPPIVPKAASFDRGLVKVVTGQAGV